MEILRAQAEMHGPLGALGSRGCSSVAWRRSVSIAEFFEQLLRGGPAEVARAAWQRAEAAARLEIAEASAAARRPRPQRALSQSLSASLYPDSFPSLLARRIASWLPHAPPLPRADLTRRWEELRRVLVRSPPAWAWAHIKTLSGAWTTAARVPCEPPRRCLFGCPDASDDFAHYISCPRLLHLLALPRGFLPPCPLTRLGLGPSPDAEVEYPRARCHRVVVLSFHIYHKLKADLASHPTRSATPAYHYDIRAAALAAMRR